MSLDELLALLDIESPEELVYFEQFADLMEEQEDIPYETLADLAEGMDPDVLHELLGSYFEDVLKAVPDGEDELYTLLINIGNTLQAMARGGVDGAGEDADADVGRELELDDEEGGFRVFAEELYKFRSWYLAEEFVYCTDLADGLQREITLFEALTNYRVQSHTGEDFEFDFGGALDYPLEEYIVSLGAIIEDDYGDGDTYGEDEDYRDPDMND